MDDVLALLHRSDQHLVRTVDSLTDDQWTEVSVLPGWTRAHVVAHVALNAEGISRALGGLMAGETVALYDSNESRDAGIADLAAQPTEVVRDRFLAATQRIRDTFAHLTPEHWAGTVSRLPAGPVWPVNQLVATRRQEVEVHHADLGAGYTADNWPADFATWLLDKTTRTHAQAEGCARFAVRATDLERTWEIGASAPVVTGAAGALGWWLVGRGAGEGLSCDRGPLPTIGSWQGQPVTPR